MGGAISLATAAAGGRVAWCVPTYKNGRPLWRWAERVVAPLRANGEVEVNRSERIITFTRSGGFLGIYSADNEDAARGEAFNLAILDEAPRMAATMWTDVIQPALADANGDAILIGSPKGRNWFFREWLRGQNGDAGYQQWQAPTSDNPNPLIKKAAQLARERVSETTYLQEWEAQFVEDAGLVFRRVRACAASTPLVIGDPKRQYVIGCDWGKHNDWTVLTAIDAASRRQVAIDRFNQIDYVVQVQRVKTFWRRFPGPIIAESNSMGDAIIEQLQRENLPVQAVTTTNASKSAMIESLQVAHERSQIETLNDETQIVELESYEMERLPSGLMRYGAPAGMHDDCVMALALAWSGVGLPIDLDDFYAGSSVAEAPDVSRVLGHGMPSPYRDAPAPRGVEVWAE